MTPTEAAQEPADVRLSRLLAEEGPLTPEDLALIERRLGHYVLVRRLVAEVRRLWEERETGTA